MQFEEYFEVGYWYRWTKEYPADTANWNSFILTMLDGKWHKCTYKDEKEMYFDDNIHYLYWVWLSDNFQYFKKSKYSPKEIIKKLLKETT
jgi:hypothetical protein